MPLFFVWCTSYSAVTSILLAFAAATPLSWLLFVVPAQSLNAGRQKTIREKLGIRLNVVTPGEGEGTGGRVRVG